MLESRSRDQGLFRRSRSRQKKRIPGSREPGTGLSRGSRSRQNKFIKTAPRSRKLVKKGPDLLSISNAAYSCLMHQSESYPSIPLLSTSLSTLILNLFTWTNHWKRLIDSIQCIPLLYILTNHRYFLGQTYFNYQFSIITPPFSQ